MTKIVKNLIIINITIFVIIHLFPGFNWLSLFGLVPNAVFVKFRIWQLFSYMFLHQGMGHLLINMLMLWFFAPAVEAAWGRRQFLYYYFFTGLGAGLCSFITAFHSSIPVIGASGAIFGILVAYCLMFPDTTILFFFVFPMKIRQAVLLLMGINLLGAVSSSGAGIAYFAHLGGALFGYLYLKSEWMKWYFNYLFGAAGLLKKTRMKRFVNKEVKGVDLDQQIDLILDKISRSGIKSISRKERQLLERKSKS